MLRSLGGWANGSIVNPTLPHEDVGLRKDATQLTRLFMFDVFHLLAVYYRETTLRLTDLSPIIFTIIFTWAGF